MGSAVRFSSPLEFKPVDAAASQLRAQFGSLGKTRFTDTARQEEIPEFNVAHEKKLSGAVQLRVHRGFTSPRLVAASTPGAAPAASGPAAAQRQDASSTRLPSFPASDSTTNASCQATIVTNTATTTNATNVLPSTVTASGGVVSTAATAETPGNSAGPSSASPELWVLRAGPPIEHDYALGRVLGQGSYGVVRLATRLSTGEAVAVKTIRKTAALVSNPASIAALRREVEILHHLAGHPHIGQLYGVYEESECLHLVMELYEGGDLYDAVVGIGRHSERAAADVMRTVLTAIGYCHAMGVAHRDIKPENFMLSASTPQQKAEAEAAAAEAGGDGGLALGVGARIKLIDFGLSCFCTDDSTLRDAVGTSYYVAPEVLEGGGYGRAADVWSAGIILHVLLLGYAPFNGADDKEIQLSVLKGVPDSTGDPLWMSLTPAAVDTLAAMLDRNPATRATADQVLSSTWLGRTAAECTAPSTPLPGVVSERLRKFAKLNSLQKEARRLVAAAMRAEEVAGLKAAFKALDLDGDGKLSAEELREGLARQELPRGAPVGMEALSPLVPTPRGELLRKREMRELVARSDLDGDGMLDESEFLGAALPAAAITRAAASTGDPVALAALARASVGSVAGRSTTGTGVLARSSVGPASPSVHGVAAPGRARSLNPLAAAFAALDKDGSGFITADEIEAVLAAHHPNGRAHGPDVQAMLAAADTDADGRISYEEFLAMLLAAEDGAGDLLGGGLGMPLPPPVQAQKHNSCSQPLPSPAHRNQDERQREARSGSQPLPLVGAAAQPKPQQVANQPGVSTQVAPTTAAAAKPPLPPVQERKAGAAAAAPGSLTSGARKPSHDSASGRALSPAAAQRSEEVSSRRGAATAVWVASKVHGYTQQRKGTHASSGTASRGSTAVEEAPSLSIAGLMQAQRMSRSSSLSSCDSVAAVQQNSGHVSVLEWCDEAEEAAEGELKRGRAAAEEAEQEALRTGSASTSARPGLGSADRRARRGNAKRSTSGAGGAQLVSESDTDISFEEAPAHHARRGAGSRASGAATPPPACGGAQLHSTTTSSDDDDDESDGADTPRLMRLSPLHNAGLKGNAGAPATAVAAWRKAPSVARVAEVGAAGRGQGSMSVSAPLPAMHGQALAEPVADLTQGGGTVSVVRAAQAAALALMQPDDACTAGGSLFADLTSLAAAQAAAESASRVSAANEGSGRWAAALPGTRAHPPQQSPSGSGRWRRRSAAVVLDSSVHLGGAVAAGVSRHSVGGARAGSRTGPHMLAPASVGTLPPPAGASPVGNRSPCMAERSKPSGCWVEEALPQAAPVLAATEALRRRASGGGFVAAGGPPRLSIGAVVCSSTPVSPRPPSSGNTCKPPPYQQPLQQQRSQLGGPVAAGAAGAQPGGPGPRVFTPSLSGRPAYATGAGSPILATAGSPCTTAAPRTASRQYSRLLGTSMAAAIPSTQGGAPMLLSADGAALPYSRGASRQLSCGLGSKEPLQVVSATNAAGANGDRPRMKLHALMLTEPGENMASGQAVMSPGSRARSLAAVSASGLAASRNAHGSGAAMAPSASLAAAAYASAPLRASFTRFGGGSGSEDEADEDEDEGPGNFFGGGAACVGPGAAPVYDARQRRRSTGSSYTKPGSQPQVPYLPAAASPRSVTGQHVHPPVIPRGTGAGSPVAFPLSLHAPHAPHAPHQPVAMSPRGTGAAHQQHSHQLSHLRLSEVGLELQVTSRCGSTSRNMSVEAIGTPSTRPAPRPWDLVTETLEEGAEGEEDGDMLDSVRGGNPLDGLLGSLMPERVPAALGVLRGHGGGPAGAAAAAAAVTAAGPGSRQRAVLGVGAVGGGAAVDKSVHGWQLQTGSSAAQSLSGPGPASGGAGGLAPFCK
ncbi:hypothetical protein HYH02_000377 [Chlamydomonas schloesseri]|uniref:Non-specific serine/threonine protein kinase n=1 Tax=Chlamydomonas schloesseri TaxID=2026947 RepID=A0A835WY99_9CHLO|nr:hypothetical protein HYH02_000377 [Chlamydomonas schloesseri]|eukprot:KAG2454530.1 hypothetical protein HYH02_000377 [Chlamydomonas schloesseri]